MNKFRTGAALAAIILLAGTANAQLFGGSGSIGGGLGGIGGRAGGTIGSMGGTFEGAGSIQRRSPRVDRRVKTPKAVATGSVMAAIPAKRLSGDAVITRGSARSLPGVNLGYIGAIIPLLLVLYFTFKAAMDVSKTQTSTSRK